MKVTVGTKAPNFSLFDNEKDQFALSEFVGHSNVLLLFFPAAFTGVCTTELNAVSNDLDSYANTKVVGISTDSPFCLAEFAKVNALKFRLLSDHDATVATNYGTKYDHDFTPMKLDRISKRSAFLIDKEGVVQYAEVLENAGEMPDLDAIKSKLASK